MILIFTLKHQSLLNSGVHLIKLFNSVQIFDIDVTIPDFCTNFMGDIIYYLESGGSNSVKSILANSSNQHQLIFPPFTFDAGHTYKINVGVPIFEVGLVSSWVNKTIDIKTIIQSNAIWVEGGTSKTIVSREPQTLRALVYDLDDPSKTKDDFIFTWNITETYYENGDINTNITYINETIGMDTFVYTFVSQ